MIDTEAKNNNNNKYRKQIWESQPHMTVDKSYSYYYQKNKKKVVITF